MAYQAFPRGLRRRGLLACAGAALLPSAVRAAGVCTPQDVATQFAATVPEALPVPRHEALIYGGLAEAELGALPEVTASPQYLLVVDSCTAVQAAFFYWRLMPGHLALLGAVPASTGDPLRPGCVATPCGAFLRGESGGGGRRAARVYDFGVQRVRAPGRESRPLRLQARAALGPDGGRLGVPRTDGSVLLPASLVALLDEYRLLDGAGGEVRTRAGQSLPFAGRLMVVLDSERDRRPDWLRA